MLKLFFYIFFIISLFIVIKYKEKSIFFLPVFHLVTDMSFTFFSTLSIATYARVILVLLFIILSYRHIKFKPYFKWLLAYFIYTLVLLLLSNEIFYSFKAYMQVFISMILIVISYYYFNSIEKINRIKKVALVIIIISVASSILGYVFGIGQVLEYTMKNEEEVVGMLGSGGLYTGAMCLGILPIILPLYKKRFIKYSIIALAVLLYIFILLNVRRTAILIPLIIISIYIFFSPNKIKTITGILIAGTFLLAGSSYYINILNKRMGLREDRFEEGIEQEGRTLENIYLFEDVMKFDQPLTSLFGIGNNIYAEAIENGNIVRRMYHSDSAKLLYGTGLVGLIIYYSFFFILIFKILKTKTLNREAKKHRSMALALIIMLVLVSYNGSITLVTFRSVSFIFLGALMSAINLYNNIPIQQINKQLPINGISYN